MGFKGVYITRTCFPDACYADESRGGDCRINNLCFLDNLMSTGAGWGWGEGGKEKTQISCAVSADRCLCFHSIESMMALRYKYEI